MLQDDPALLIAALGGGAVLLFYLCGVAPGRPRSARGTIIPLFGPPKGMSAAAVRFVDRMQFDDRVFTAAIVDLGVNGHLKLIDRGGDQEVRHIKGSRPVDAAEQAVETALFAGRTAVDLEQRQSRTDRQRPVQPAHHAAADVPRLAVQQQFLAGRASAWLLRWW